ncbi:MAG: UDP-N-acetylmuramoyl-tripeptide--D-alanyl-D-alanine ligase [Ruminococcaceae bacterium]|nr:UDP-N-acetylmuramoyl-tripeptide--D-alanyl-D-alanine ligase [Oscillospiraceae bacterium]
MKPMTIEDIVKATGGRLLQGNPNATVCAISTDTRNPKPDSLFIPLVGERFDAHNFIVNALSGGCTASLTMRKGISCPDAEKALILVDDTRRALGALSASYRNQFSLPLLAITGSVGKTTVKELTSAALSARLHVLKTDGNFNNEIGLPLTLFRLEETHEAAIIEMGMSGFGEIDALASIASPDIGIVTNIGLSHIEKLGSQENIYRAKAELFSHIAPGGTIILNGDDPILMAHRHEIACRVLTVGTDTSHDLWASDVSPTQNSVSFTLHYKGENHSVTLGFPGEHNVINALLACAAALCLSIPLPDAIRAMSLYRPDSSRMRLVDAGGITIIDDCYNAAPASVSAALKVLCAHPGRKIAVLGDIKELGSYAESAHKHIGKEAASLGVDLLFGFGDNAKWIVGSAQGVTAFHYDNIDALNEALSSYVKEGDTVLIKGSRAMHLERVTEHLTKTRN